MRLTAPTRLIVLVTMLNFLGCLREPASAPRGDDACEAMCVSLVCLHPDTSSEVVADCKAICLAKFEESASQGPSCAETFADAMDCLAELSCSEYASWTSSEAGHLCPSARSDVKGACDGIYLEPEVLPP